MRLITKVYVKDTLGLEKHEKGAEEFAQICLRRWVAAKCSGKTKKGKAAMRGGAPVLPSDYYGVQGAGYVDSDAGTSMAPTAEWSRPMIPETFTKSFSGGSGCSACAGPVATMAIAGGAKTASFAIPMTAFKSVVGKKVSEMMNEKELAASKAKFETLFEKALKKAARLDKAEGKKVLSRTSLEKVVSSEKQFAAMC